uniref:Uncharacterized protein TCIL3000_11_14530 n=1 Tax=Trypanosoma congolense (strain IL3000) TaxID=1068625 RepID=G0V2R4_TRYCI|nr:unnamed protein product [Trypanosoma congolense IL3000]
MSQKAKRPPNESGLLTVAGPVGLPLWDPVQVQQENWGGALGLPAREPGFVLEPIVMEGKSVMPADVELCSLFKECILSLSGTAGIEVCKDFEVQWRRPADMFAPFRPLVHRNTTPFYDPYEPQRQFDIKAPVQQTPAKKSEAKGPVVALPLHLQFPEIVGMTDQQPDEVVAIDEQWNVAVEEVVARYQTMQPLMQAYDVELEHGCARTPAEACATCYSTAQRHKLDQADAISRLSMPPPFVMGAFNTALKFIESERAISVKGGYLWELVYPHAPGTCHPVYNPHGKYVVRLYIDGLFRQVAINDYLPVDALGRSFFTVTSQKEIWPALIAKALFIALGPSRHLLFTDSEAIITCLLGEWVPQRIDPCAQPDLAAAVLLAARQDTYQDASGTPPLGASLKSTPRKGGDVTINEPGESRSPLRKMSPKRNPSFTRNSRPMSRRSMHTNGQSALSITELGITAPPISGVPVVCATGILPCGRRKLYVIHDVVVFRDTLALKISTNPPSSIIRTRTFSPDSTDEEVQVFLNISKHGELNNKNENGRHGQSSPSQAFSPFWVTFEELAEQLDIVVWRYLGQSSPYAFHHRIANVEASSHASKKKVNADSSSIGLGHPLKPVLTRWIHISCNKTEQLVIVNLGGTPSLTPSGLWRLPRHRTPSVANASTGQMTLDNQFEQPGSSKIQWEEVREVHLDLYRWDRGDVFCHVAAFFFEQGNTSCLMHTLPPGSYVFRVTVLGLDNHEVVSIFSTSKFLLGEEKDVLRAASIFKIGDAGSHSGVEKPNEEVVWFKHRFTVKESTTVSFVLTTLDSRENPSVYRDMPGSAMKDARGSRARASAKPQGKEPARNLHQTGEHSEILPYTRLLLMNLDTGATRRGAVGRLVLQHIEPNQKGYLIMAYVIVDEVSALLLAKSDRFLADSAVNCTPRERDSEKLYQSAEKVSSAVSTSAPLLFPRGLWRLVVLSNVALDGYKAISKDAWSFADKGQLKQGSHCLLFSYTCTFTDRTDITILLDVIAQSPIPFQIKIFRVGVEAPPVFVSEVCEQHLFVPHTTVELSEKSKGILYSIEAWLDKDKVEEWELKRRAAQRAKFCAARDDAEARANVKHQQEIQEYYADPVAFKDRLRKQDLAATENAILTPVREQMAVNHKKSRNVPDKRKAVGVSTQNSRPLARSLPGSCLTNNSVALLIDTIDPDIVVSYDLRLFFSMKTEVRNGPPPKDPLMIMRGLWVPPIEHMSPDAVLLSGGRSNPQRGKQKDVSPSPEELFKADQGRVSRQQFLDNPRNILFPHLTQTEEARCGDENATTSPWNEGISVVVEVEDEPNFPHAPILDESKHFVQSFPLRAMEIVPQTQPILPGSASNSPSLRVRSPPARAVVPPIPINYLPTTEDGAITLELKIPMNDLSLRLWDELKHEEERRTECRNGIKGLLQAYWEPRKPGASLSTLPITKEEDGSRRGRARSRV